MNARARAMGLGCTHFSSVSGIVDRGNHSCARDLARLAHAVLGHRLLARIVATRDAVLPFPIRGGKLYLYNNNPLLRSRLSRAPTASRPGTPSPPAAAWWPARAAAGAGSAWCCCTPTIRRARRAALLNARLCRRRRT